MFDHSIKVPRLYKNASKVAKAVTEGRGSIKQLVYESKHPNIKALYALVVHVFQRTTDIENLLKKSKLLVKEPRFDPWLAKILITELLWGKKHLSGQSKPVMTILAYEQIFKAHLSDLSQNEVELEQVEKPRYVRINTLKITINEAIEGFRDEGWVLKRYNGAQNYTGFLEAVTNLGSEEFMVDLHLSYLLIFPPKTQFYQHPAYKNGSIILQDKASCLPVHILNPEPGSIVLDMCAAPGMKTSHCASVLENKGKIFAVEIGKKRFETLNKIIESSGATCVETINRDVLTLTDEHCPNVEYILVDPSCSGSGITDRIEIGQQEMEQHQNRLQKLSGFQIKMLRHALTKFPKARRVVYSTCSLYPEENEDVVRQVLETCWYFKMVPAGQFVQGRWLNFGSPEFGLIGNYSCYAKPDIDFTSGFFVAVFERLAEGEHNPLLNTNLLAFSKQNRAKKRKRKDDLECGGDELSTVERQSHNENDSENGPKSTNENKEVNDDDTDTKNKKKKKNKKQEKLEEKERSDFVVEELRNENETEGAYMKNSNDADVSLNKDKKKKKKKRKEDKKREEVNQEESHEIEIQNNDVLYQDVGLDEDKKKKKKRKKEKEDVIHEENNTESRKKKKTKRSNEEEADIENTEGTSVADGVKKKKKNKHKEPIIDSPDNINLGNMAKESKKKKLKSNV